MRAALISPLTLTHDAVAQDAAFDLAEHIPLGLLAIGASCTAAGHQIVIIDSNAELLELGMERRHDIAEVLAERVSAAACDVVGLGSISQSYPTTLRTAMAISARTPGAVRILGGPQASAVAKQTLQAYPSIDFVLAGEADLTFPQLLDYLEHGGEPSEIGGLAHRDRGMVRLAPLGSLPELDQLPLPLYELGPPISPETTLALELGRGCPYGCTFCSTNDFFRRRFRLKSPALVLAQMQELAARFGTMRYELVHDMFTVDRRRVVELCEVLAGAGFQWSVSARTDRVDAELLQLMYGAGCRGIFFGIETGSQRLQRTIRKKLDVGQAAASVRSAADVGMRAIASLIIGFPEEGEQELRETVNFFIEALRSPRVSPQLHLLAPLAGTPLTEAHALIFDGLMSDMSTQPSSVDEAAMIRSHPVIFSSFYALPSGVPRAELALLRSFLIEAAVETRWLLIALHEQWHAVDMHRRYREWAGANHEVERRSLLRFAREVLLPEALAPFAIDSLIALHGAWTPNPATGSEPAAEAAPVPPSGWQPRLARDVRLLRLRTDYARLHACLRSGGAVSTLSAADSHYLLRVHGDAHTVIELDGALATVLARCDGACDVATLAGCGELALEPLKASLDELVALGLVQ